MDIDTVQAMLDEIHRRSPRLPHDRDLARALLAEWNSNYQDGQVVQQAAIEAVTDAAWPAGYRAGAGRGHAVAVGLVHDALVAAQNVAPPRHERPSISRRPSSDGPETEWLRQRRGPYEGWLLYAARRGAKHLPAEPDLSGAEQTSAVRGLRPVSSLASWYDETQQLREAASLGLSVGWRVGHREATTAVVDEFLDQVQDLVGDVVLLTTTFLHAQTSGWDWLQQVADDIHEASEHDRTHPPPPAPRPVVARAFPPLAGQPTHRGGVDRRPPGTGPGRRPRSR